MDQPRSSEFATLWRQNELPGIVRNLAARGNEGRIRTLVADILHHGFGADYLAIDHEVRLPEVHGRADALFGATVFEFKQDLRQEMADARSQLERYIRVREAQLNRRFLGIATDGATFVAVELRDGALVEISRYDVRPDRPQALLDWLGPAVSPLTDLLPEPLIVQRELGRYSLTFARARGDLDRLWAALSGHSEVALKRQLWDGLLREVYAAAVGDDALFLQHISRAFQARRHHRAAPLLHRRGVELRREGPAAVSGAGLRPDRAAADGGDIADRSRALHRRPAAPGYERGGGAQGAPLAARSVAADPHADRCLVERDPERRLGQNAAAPGVHGKTGGQDKLPWRNVDPPHGPVEAQFLRPVVLGETIAPFRLLEPALGVIPVAGTEVMDARAAAEAGYPHLAGWLRDVEAKWGKNAAKRVDKSLRMTLLQRLNHMRGLSAQLGIQSARIAYAKAGTLFAAALLTEDASIVDHMAYWAPIRSSGEGRYLSAILNSDAARERIAPMQPKGQGGARHFDNLIWELPIPEFDRRNALHAEIAQAAEAAERVAAAVPLPEGAHFTRQRRAIRDALAATGVAERIDALVARLLG